MKILLSVPSWPPGDVANGIVTYTSHLVPALREMGHEVYLLTGDRRQDDPWTIDLAPYFRRRTLRQRIEERLAPGRSFFRASSEAVRAAVEDLCRRVAPDVFETEESFGLAYRIAKQRILPVVIRLHGPWFLGQQFLPHLIGPIHDGRIRAEEGAIAVAHGLSSPSRAILDSVAKVHPIPTIHSAIPNPISIPIDFWRAAEVRPRSILFVGRFDLLKGGDLILETFRRLADNYHDVSLTFVGSDDGLPKNDGSQISFSEFAATHIPTKDRARLKYHGALTPAEVHQLRRLHFLTVVASRQEVMPYSVLETMAFGAPIIATAVGGIPEVVRNGVNGLLVPPTAEGLTAACGVLFRDPKLAERLGQQARIDTANRRPLLIAQKTLDLYTEVIEQFKTQSR